MSWHVAPESIATISEHVFVTRLLRWHDETSHTAATDGEAVGAPAALTAGSLGVLAIAAAAK